MDNAALSPAACYDAGARLPLAARTPKHLLLSHEQRAKAGICAIEHPSFTNKKQHVAEHSQLTHSTHSQLALGVCCAVRAS